MRVWRLLLEELIHRMSGAHSKKSTDTSASQELSSKLSWNKPLFKSMCADIKTQPKDTDAAMFSGQSWLNYLKQNIDLNQKKVRV